jgi:hypothetical protein
VAEASERGALRFAYADPPYLGCCRLYDHEHGTEGLCWDDLTTHRLLIERLVTEFPDGWALSCTSGSLRDLLPLCPSDVRVSAWCKSFSAFKKGVRPAYAWEPLIWRGGRNPSCGFPHRPPPKGGKQTTPKDFLWLDGWGEDHDLRHSALLAPITLKRGLTGAKPKQFCEWVVALLNVQPGDEIEDLFPGTGVMGQTMEGISRGR